MRVEREHLVHAIYVNWKAKSQSHFGKSQLNKVLDIQIFKTAVFTNNFKNKTTRGSQPIKPNISKSLTELMFGCFCIVPYMHVQNIHSGITFHFHHFQY